MLTSLEDIRELKYYVFDNYNSCKDPVHIENMEQILCALEHMEIEISIFLYSSAYQEVKARIIKEHIQRRKYIPLQKTGFKACLKRLLGRI